MRTILLPLFFVIASVGTFFSYIDSQYADIQVLQGDASQLNQALDRSRELQSIRDQLLSRYNTFPEEELVRLQKFLPDHVDTVRLVLDLDGIAEQHAMRIKEFSFTTDEDTDSGGTNSSKGKGTSQEYGVMNVRFSTSATFDDFLTFLKDLEHSLRLIDVTSVSVTGGLTTSGPNLPQNYGYTVEFKTYWLH